jgi:ATP-dependent 26S proteasome regulatory subunit
MRPGRLDRKIEIPLPNEVARMEILKIHATPIQKQGEIGTYIQTSYFRHEKQLAANAILSFWLIGTRIKIMNRS